MGVPTRTLALAALVVAVLGAVASPSAGRGSPPVAHIACTPTGVSCSETGTLSLPANGFGSQSTDVVPSGSTSVTETTTPTDANDANAFDSTWASVVSSFPKFAGIKSKPVRRVITCAIVARAAADVAVGAYGDTVEGKMAGNDRYALVLSICISVLFDIQQAAANKGLTAAAGCSQAMVSLPIEVMRTARGYVARATGKTMRPREQPTLLVACKPKGIGLQLTIKPRARRTKLGQVIGPHARLGFSNPTAKPLAISTTFTFR